MNSLNQVLLLFGGQWIGKHWVAKGIAPENSCLVRLIYGCLRKDQFPSVITKHWTLENTCMDPGLPQCLFLVWVND